MTKIIKVNSGSKTEEIGSYSRVVCVDDWVFVSNTAGRNPETNEFSDDPLEQVDQVFKNIERALAAVDATLSDVIFSRVFIAKPEDTHRVMEAVGKKFRGINPATTVTSPPLGSDKYLVEIELRAFRGASKADVQEIRL
jgi:enamine deaminase RidA (YjgF/YER057c/UK114 family)